MTLTTHSIIAAAVTKPLAAMNPLFAFIVAIASHYLSDAIPHWDYQLGSIENSEDKQNRHWATNRRTLARDISYVTLDGFLGASIILLAIHPTTLHQWTWALAAIVGGCLPDFLQGLYIFKLKFLHAHQQFHDICHTKIRLGHYPLVGIPFQTIFIAIALYVLI